MLARSQLIYARSEYNPTCCQLIRLLNENRKAGIVPRKIESIVLDERLRPLRHMTPDDEKKKNHILKRGKSLSLPPIFRRKVCTKDAIKSYVYYYLFLVEHCTTFRPLDEIFRFTLTCGAMGRECERNVLAYDLWCARCYYSDAAYTSRNCLLLLSSI